MNHINDQVISQGAQIANQTLANQLQQIAQLFQQAVQIVQAKSPPPQMPPEVQGAIQIAKMETERKTTFDKASLDAKVQAQAADDRMKQVEAQQKILQQQFDQALAKAESQQKAAVDAMAQQIEVMRNKQDNDQHQITEILKNNQDNMTNIIVERMKLMQDANAKLVEGQPKFPMNLSIRTLEDTFGPLVQAMNAGFEASGQNADAQAEQLKAHNEAIAQLTSNMQDLHKKVTKKRKITLIRDPVTGKPVGADSMLEE